MLKIADAIGYLTYAMQCFPYLALGALQSSCLWGITIFIKGEKVQELCQTTSATNLLQAGRIFFWTRFENLDKNQLKSDSVVLNPETDILQNGL